MCLFYPRSCPLLCCPAPHLSRATPHAILPPPALPSCPPLTPRTHAPPPTHHAHPPTHPPTHPPARPQVRCLKTLREIEGGKAVEECMEGYTPDAEGAELMSRGIGVHPFIQAAEDTM